MESPLSEESVWASALAARLRLIQANFADDDAATRRDFIVQEIERALKGSVPEKRKALLAALALRFPSWQGSVPDNRPAPSTPAIPETPEALLEQFLDILPSVSSDQRANFTEKLKRAGVVPEKTDVTIEVDPKLLERLGVPGQSFSAARVAVSFAMLLDMVLALDQFVTKVWKEIAPKSMVSKEADFPRLAGKYLVGGEEVSASQLMQTIEKNRRLISSLLSGFRPAATAFARDRKKFFEPAAIESAARPEKKFTESQEFASWRKYKQLFDVYLTEARIEKDLEEALVKAAEGLLKKA